MKRHHLKNKKILRDEIRQFQKRKGWFALPIIILGLLGLVLPVIPGIPLILLGIILLFPLAGEKLIFRIRDWIKKWIAKVRNIFQKFRIRL